MFELFMYVYSCNALSARFSAVYRALNYFMIMIMTCKSKQIIGRALSGAFSKIS